MSTPELANAILLATAEPKKRSARAPVLKPRGVSEADAATFLGISRSTLRKSRMNGMQDGHIPPVPFVRAGRRVIYLIEDLNGWLQQLRVSVGDEQTESATILPLIKTEASGARNHG